MVQWTTFAGITGVVLVLLLVLSHLTQTAFSDGSDADGPESSASASSHRDASTTPAEPSSASDTAADESESVTPVRDSLSSTETADEGEGGGEGEGTDRGSNVPFERSDDAEANAAAGADADADQTTPAETGPDGRPMQSNAQSPESPAIDVDVGRRPRQGVDPQSLSTGELLANVALSQGLFACVLLGAVVYTGIPAAALGVEFSTAYLRQGLVWGTAFGLVLYASNEVGAAVATHVGFDHDEQLRELLAPESARGWLALLVFVLPLIAGFEELLFRAALIGVLSSGFGISPWLLAVVSSVAFAVGHGMQGSVGIVVTGLLGFVLAAIYVVSGSLLVVVVAHYLINALEFVVHEGVGVDWAATLES